MMVENGQPSSAIGFPSSSSDIPAVYGDDADADDYYGGLPLRGRDCFVLSGEISRDIALNSNGDVIEVQTRPLLGHALDC